ncbi:MAG: hypothetical protein HC882_00280 [Acidobacteria bacterium]|nr:hypothetical protein [Acidobacteriota bacterium]
MTIFKFMGGSTGGASADRFAPRIIVGNVPAGDPNTDQSGAFRYIPDPGDGSGISTAITEANTLAAGGDFVDIYLRPGLYDLEDGPTVLPTLGSGVRLYGTLSANAGSPQTEIRSRVSAGSQRILNMATRSEVDMIYFRSPAPTANLAGDAEIVNAAAACGIKNCQFSLEGSVAFDRTATRCITISGDRGDVSNLILSVSSLLTQPTPAYSLGIFVGSTTTWSGPLQPTEIKDCRQQGGNSAVQIWNVSGSSVSHYRASDIDQPQVGFAWLLSADPGAFDDVPGPIFEHCYLYTNTETDALVNSEQVGFLVVNQQTDAESNVPMLQFTLDHCQVDFGVPAAPDPGVSKVGFRIRAEENTDLGEGTITAPRSRGHNIGFHIVSAGVNAASLVTDIRVTGGVIQSAIGNTGTNQYNVWLNSNGNGGIRRIGIVGNGLAFSFSGTVIRLDDPTVENTIIVGNNIGGDPATLIDDSGTNTEQSHNI